MSSSSPKGLDFNGLNEYVGDRSRELVPAWLPGGVLRGREYKCADLFGGRGESLSVNIQTGIWKDFATGDGGGDFISLYAAINNMKQGDAAKRLANVIGFNLNNGKILSDFQRGVPPRPKEKPEVAPTLPPPNFEKPDLTHSKIGRPTMHWEYRNELNQTMFFVARYELDQGKKLFLPWSFDASKNQYTQRGWFPPRPLYGLEKLRDAPNAPILLVEGEKACEAARTFIGNKYIVMTWPNGVNGFQNVDLAPIYGRKVLLWPDADSGHVYRRPHPRADQVMDYEDQPGPKCMLAIASRLSPHCPEIKLIDVKDVQIDGWDAADAKFQTFSEFAAWARPRAVLFKQPEPEPVVTPDPPTMSIQASDYLGPKEVLWRDLGLQIQNQKSPYNNAYNVFTCLKALPIMQGRIWYDNFNHRLMTTLPVHGISTDSIDPREYQDSDDNNLLIWLQKNVGFYNLTTTVVRQAVGVISNQDIRNEPLDWVNSLKWDGKDRVYNAFHHMFSCEDNEYTRAVSRNFFIAIAARLASPGCKYDDMVILEGGQGKRKSSALRALGGKWFRENNTDIRSEDFITGLQGALIVEIPEMDAMKKADAARIKAILSTQVDSYRPKYGRNVQNFKRQCVIVGTTNRDDYLYDETGERRKFPVEIGERIDINWINLNREQLFAEAMHRYKQGETWWDYPEVAANAIRDRKMSREFNEDRFDSWSEIISDYLSQNSKLETTVNDVLLNALHFEPNRISRNDQMRASKCLKTIGFQPMRAKKNGVNVRFWCRAEAWT